MGGQGWTCRTCRRTSADKRAVSLATVRVSALSVLGAWVGYPCECLAHPRYSDIAGEDVLFRKAQGGETGAKDDREGPTGERMPTTPTCPTPGLGELCWTVTGLAPAFLVFALLLVSEQTLGLGVAWISIRMFTCGAVGI